MLKSFDEMTPDQQLAYKMGYKAAHSELRVASRDDEIPTPLVTSPATTQDLIEAVESIGGEICYMTKLGDGQVSENGRYLVIPLDALTEQEPCPACGSTTWGECGWCA